MEKEMIILVYMYTRLVSLSNVCTPSEKTIFLLSFLGCREYNVIVIIFIYVGLEFEAKDSEQYTILYCCYRLPMIVHYGDTFDGQCMHASRWSSMLDREGNKAKTEYAA